MTDVLRYAAFTASPDGGNPAGVVLDADGLTDEGMQSIAADVGYSETAFVRSGTAEDPRRRALRFFSPLAEVSFCGHATIATSVALSEREGAGPWLFATAVGEITVETSADDSGVSARLRSVPTRSEPASASDLEPALAALRWPTSDLAELPVHVAFAGNHHLIVPAGSRERLAHLDYDFEGLKSLMTDRGWTTIQLVYIETETLIHSRNPFPVGGVVEDPATGAAAAALGGYLRAIGKVGQSMTIKIRQGDDMGRPSELLLTVAPDDPQVTVEGRAVPIRT